MLYPIPSWADSPTPLSVRLVLEDFEPPSLNRKGTMFLTGLQLAWAALTSGRMAPVGYIDDHLQFAANQEAMNFWRISSCLGFLTPTFTNGDADLSRSSSAEQLESTERTQISYAVGSMMARAFSAFELDLPLMVHSKWLEATQMIKYRGSERPDYVAFDHFNEPVIVEAKGTQLKNSWYSALGRLREKDQVNAVLSVRGIPVARRLGCATLFPKNGALSFFCVDPDYRLEYFEPDLDLIVNTYYRSFSVGGFERGSLERACAESLELLERAGGPDRDVPLPRHMNTNGHVTFIKIVRPPELSERLEWEPKDRLLADFHGLRQGLERIYPKQLIMPDLTLALLEDRRVSIP